MPKEYVRDHRSPRPTNETTSKVMSSNKGKDTNPEKTVRRMLKEAGYPGYRLHWNIPGRPDITYPGKKVAIFVNGCFWHRCPFCNLPLPKSNTGFWEDKFKKNIERDGRNISLLENDGWNTFIIWECKVSQKDDRAWNELIAKLK